MKFTRVPENTFKNLQLNAGVLAKEFTPASGTIKATDLIGATTGGINFTAQPDYIDFAEDIDNAPKNMLEFKRLDQWNVSMSGTFVSITSALAKMLVASGDVDSQDATKIVPRNDLATTDFSDLWWIGDYSDKNGNTNGGYIAIHMLNALSTGGFQIQTGDKVKGNFSFEFTGHYSIASQDTVPFEVYVKEGSDEPNQ
jgi:hypothetical protein